MWEAGKGKTRGQAKHDQTIQTNLGVVPERTLSLLSRVNTIHSHVSTPYYHLFR